MTDLLEPLTESEIQTLDEFLLNRFPDEDEMIGRDEGLLNISELDGFLTAIVSGPDLVPPSEWLPLVWGDEEPVWESEAGFQHIFSLMIRQMNGIAGELLGAPEEFEPLFMERTVKGKTHLIVDDWCGGYLRGASLWFDGWREEAPESLDLLAPIFVFGHERGWKFLDEMAADEVERSQESVAPAARAIHRFWLERRPNAAESLRRTSRIGRNEPCPCGSRKKYKRCCLGSAPVN